MADFGPWLRNNTDNSPALAAVRAFAEAQAATWPYQSNTVDDYLAVINQTAPNNAGELRLTIYQYYVIWLANSVASTQRRISFGPIALVFAGLIIAAFLLYGVMSPTFVGSLANAAQARGLVTFLFAFATTSVIVVVTIGVLWVPKDEVEPRFSKAKDIMTILISVLGTILGFYFGQAQNPNAPPSQPAPQVSTAAPAATKPAATESEAPRPVAPATSEGAVGTPNATPPPAGNPPSLAAPTTGQSNLAAPQAGAPPAQKK
jgi:hypothetical protein